MTAASVPPLRGLRSASSSGIIPPPAEPSPPAPAPAVAAAPARSKPLFAIKPDGAQHSRLKAPVVQPISSPENSPRAQDPITLPKVTRKESNSSALSSPRTKLGQPVRGGGRDVPAEPPPSRIGAAVARLEPQSSIGASVGRIEPQSSIGTSVGRIQPAQRGGVASGVGRLGTRGSSGQSADADPELDRDMGGASQRRQPASRNTAGLTSQYEQPEAPRRTRPNVLDELSQVSASQEPHVFERDMRYNLRLHMATYV